MSFSIFWANMGLALCLAVGCLTLVDGAYSEVSETREVLSLNGVWNCYCEREGEPLAYLQQGGLRKLYRIFKMPVPGSLLDFTAQIDPKSCTSTIWYERSFFIPTNWKNDRKVWLRLDAASAGTELWINGERIATSNNSFVLTEFDVTERLVFDAENLIALAVRHPTTPQSVSLLSIPEMLFIQSVSVTTSVTNGTASVKYKVAADGLLQQNRKCISVQILDADRTPVASDHICGDLEGILSIPNCQLWWPICMNARAGYLYTLVFKLFYKYCDTVVRDVYRQKLGIRTLSWSNNSLTINGRSLYLYGVETNDERKPFNPQVELRDIGLLKWLSANVIVTKLAPSQEMLDLTDELGLLVILGSPRSSLEHVVLRFRNHPSVISWSVTLEEGLNSNSKGWEQFDDSLIDGRQLDNSRPFTAVVPLSNSTLPLVNKLDLVSISLKGVSLVNMFSSHVRDSIERIQKPIIFMYGDSFLSTNNRIRTLKYDPYPEFNELQRCLETLEKDVAIVGEFFGNLVAYENFTDTSLTVVDGIFNRNREPTEFADFIRSKFRERRVLLNWLMPRCKFNKKHHRKRV